MMSKEFIPYEEALALKELGFDEECFGFYDDIDSEHELYQVHTQTWNETHRLNKQLTRAPLYQQAFRWFREKYNLIFQIKYLFNGNYAVVIHKNTHEYMHTIQDLTHACVDEIPDNYSYEESELACLKKLIEIVNQNKDE